MVMNIQGEGAVAFHEEAFQLYAPSQCRELGAMQIDMLMFVKWIQDNQCWYYKQ